MTDNLPMATILSEMDQIQSVMREAPQTYFRDNAMQARYRTLIHEKQGPATVIDENSEPMVPILSLKDYAKETGSPETYSDYLKVTRTASDWVFAMPAGEQRKFVRSVDALPVDVGVAMIAEVMSYPPQVPFSSERALAEFAKLPEGPVLMREWGGLSARNLARVRERLFRVIDRVDERQGRAFCNWLENLSTNCAIALYRKLAA